MDVEHVRMAVMQRSSENELGSNVFLLEQLGGTFQVVWKSETLFSFTGYQLEVQDINIDGNYEVIYEDHSYGTGGGSRSLHVYFPEGKKLCSLTESINWQNLSGPVAPTVTINDEFDTNVVRQIEKVASKRGFLQEPIVVDFEDPEFAVQRWHKENGKFPLSKVKVHPYKGLPKIRSTVMATLRDSERVWISLFKGPLIEYDMTADHFCIVYSPAWFYNWVRCMSFDGQRLWCGVHCMRGLISYEPLSGKMMRHEKFRGQDLPEVNTLSNEGGFLVLNGAIKFTYRESSK
jgi:hypothetical protein